MIKELSILGYRGFETKQTLRLAIPNGELGSGFTVIVGPNGGGKSTIIESFKKLSRNQHVAFSEGKRNKVAGEKVEIRVKWSDLEGVLKTLKNGGSETEWIPPGQRPKIYHLPSRRVFTPFFSQGEWGRDQFIENSGDPQSRSQPMDSFTYRLKHALSHFAAFSEIFERVYGRKLDWTIDQNESNQYYLKVLKKNTVTHNSDGLGEGVVSLLFLVDALFEVSVDEVIVIDEPELSLHPQLQRRLLREMLECSRKHQIVIATHSAEMISISAILNGGTIARVADGEGGCTIHQLTTDARNQLGELDGNLNNPHGLGYDARACLFADDPVIVTEGQDDVVLLRKLEADLKLGFELPYWGFGAGGSGNISKVATILKSLGFKRVGALFDGDKVNDAAQFAVQFPEFAKWVLMADDIRDKKPTNIPAKAGILDVNRELKVQYREPVIKLFNEMKNFAQPPDPRDQ